MEHVQVDDYQWAYILCAIKSTFLGGNIRTLGNWSNSLTSVPRPASSKMVPLQILVIALNHLLSTIIVASAATSSDPGFGSLIYTEDYTASLRKVRAAKRTLHV